MGTNLDNREVNTLKLEDSKFERVGSCDDCHGRCCNFMTFNVNEGGGKTYWRLHGELFTDQWHPDKDYIVIQTDCRECSADGLCNVFDSADMPEACRQFPISPNDTVWRYLKQNGTPCGFDFIDSETKEPWDMARTDYEKEDGESTENLL